MKKKIAIYTLVAALMLLLSIFGANASDSGNYNVTTTVQNNNPTIITVTSISAQDPTESGATTVEVNFTAQDLDGNSNLNDSSAQGSFLRTGETTRSDSLCADSGNPDENSTLYQCLIDMQFYDEAGVWNINVTIEDINSISAYNDTTTFTYNSLKAIVIEPATVNFGTLYLNQVDQESTAPTTINNTGNVVIASGGINVTAQNLVGQTNGAYNVGAGNLTVSTATGTPLGDTMVSNNQVSITGATLPRGIPGSNQEQLFYYIDVPGSITAQVYSSDVDWIISV